MLDVMALATFVICKEIDRLDRADARRGFIVALSKSLVNANIENRMNDGRICKQFATRISIEAYFGKPLTVNIFQTVF